MSGAAEPGTLLTFDCYGTLIDWETGIHEALLAAYPEAEAIDAEALLSEFHEIQNELKTSGWRSYRRLLTQVCLRLADRHGWDPSPEPAGTIPAGIPTWKPFPDTNRALERLVDAGMALGILSNIDDDLLAGTLERFTADFEFLGTAERLRSYKPADAHFELGRAWVRSRPTAAWFHVAQSLFHDVRPAVRLGIPVVWVNRKDEELPPGIRPVHAASDLAGAADWLVGGPPEESES